MACYVWQLEYEPEIQWRCWLKHCRVVFIVHKSDVFVPYGCVNSCFFPPLLCTYLYQPVSCCSMEGSFHRALAQWALLIRCDTSALVDGQARLSSSLTRDLSHGYVSTAHIPLTHHKSRQSQRCVSLRARGSWGMGATHRVSISLTDWPPMTLWPCLSPGVLCEGHWHLDGGVPSVCVCCPAGVRSG